LVISVPIFYTAILLLDLFAVKWNVYQCPEILLLQAIFYRLYQYVYLERRFILRYLLKDWKEKVRRIMFRFIGEMALSEIKLFFAHIFPNAAIKLIPSFFQSIGLMIG